MKLYEWLCLLGVPTIIGFLWTALVNRRIKAHERREEVARMEAEEENRLAKERAELLLKQQQAVMLGIQALLRDRLRQGYQHYMAKGWANYEDRRDMENLYEQYHVLGQNGAMDDMREAFLALPYAPATV